MTNYLRRRQNVITEMDTEALNSMLEQVVDSFEEKWLSENGTNPVQILWNRRDALATNELFLLGNAIQRFSSRHPEWVAEQVRHIKSSEPNNRSGALFELLALSYFSHDESESYPSPINHPGYDGVVTLSSGHTIQLSLKCYGESSHNRLFKTKCEETKTRFLELCRLKNTNRILFSTMALKHPNQGNWEQLIDSLDSGIDCFVTNGEAHSVIDETWMIHINQLKNEGIEFAEKYISFSFIVMVPYHKNEHKNLIDKLDEACSNFERHSSNTPDTTTKSVFVHIPETASVSNCLDWANQYFQDNQQTPIGTVILYQPSVATSQNADKTGINHCAVVATGPAYQRWYRSIAEHRPIIPIKILIGTVTTKPIRTILMMDDNRVDIKNLYLFQRGDHYHLTKTDTNGRQLGNIRNIASGIFTHAVVQRSRRNEFILCGIFPPENKLVLW